MVEFRILSGKMAGTTAVFRRFPVRIGREAAADLRCEEPGVWQGHACFDWVRGKGIVLRTAPEAPASLNGEAASQDVLVRNGDTIGLGSVVLQFWLAETRQSGGAFREWLTWAAIGAICALQVGLIYWLLADA
jgi:hypothetical protein